MISRLAYVLSLISIFTLSVDRSSAQQVTWSQHIAPIIYKHCTNCHRPGEIGPIPLLSYADVVKELYLVHSYVDTRQMPPWKPDSGYGHFLDERRLTVQEISLIDQWADGGHPRGDSTTEPPPPVFPTGSQLGTPDLVLKMSEPYFHPGDGKDMYRCFVIPSGLLEDKYISAVEFRPGNGAIVHHALIYIDTTKAGRGLDAADAGPGYTDFGGVGFDAVGTLGGWVPGYAPRFFPPNIAWSLPKGADLVVQIHYAPTSTDAWDQSSINLFFSKDPNPRNVLVLVEDPSNIVSGGQFILPPNAVKKFTASWTCPIPLSLMSVIPHMHLLGHQMKVYAVSPARDTTPIIWIKDWDFHWQNFYTLNRLLKLSPGTRLVVESEYDNTTNNPDNPNDPPIQVRWGEGTHDEMMICYFFGLAYQAGDESINLETTPTSAKPPESAPTSLLLGAPFANPTSDELHLPFTIDRESSVSLSLFDMLGNEVARLVDGQRYTPGVYLKSCSVGQLSGGRYIARLRAGGKSESRVVQVVR